MKKELPHYNVGDLYGFNQEIYSDFTLRLGGCAATTACEACIILKKKYGLDRLCPFSTEDIPQADFEAFALQMKPYLRPRLTGIDKLSIYTEGFGAYLSNIGETRLSIEEVPGDIPYENAARRLMGSIDEGIPVPMLVLYHKNPAFREYVWHWFLLNAYDTGEASEEASGARDLSFLSVKTATFGEYEWVSFYDLWNTGFEKKGGMILLHVLPPADA